MTTATAPAPTLTADDLAFLGSLQMAGGADWKAPYNVNAVTETDRARSAAWFEGDW